MEPRLRAQPTGPLGGPGVAVVDWIRALVGLTALGLAIVFVFPRFTQRTLGVAGHSPWLGLGVGFALLVGVPVLAVAVLVIGIILGGWWIALLAVGAYATALVVGYTLAAVFLGRSAIHLLRLSEQHLAWYLLEGLALLGLIALVPVLGGLVLFGAVTFGLGILTLGMIDAYRARPAVAADQIIRPAPVNGVLVPAPTTPS
jgi:hypothetical protein